MGPFNFAADPPPCISSQADKTIFPAWECQIAEMAGGSGNGVPMRSHPLNPLPTCQFFSAGKRH